MAFEEIASAFGLAKTPNTFNHYNAIEKLLEVGYKPTVGIMNTQKRKAVALMSGGLDSTLAAKIIQDQGVEVLGLHLNSPFACLTDVQKSADAIGVSLLFKEKGAAYLDLIENPRYGYGRAMNPCIDCRIFMFQLADIVRREQEAHFVVTGEVLGQRPLSQHRHAMDLIEHKSPLEGLVLRPLSAHLLPPTVPEKEGWVDREQLFKISGRSRKEQFHLAEKLSIHDYSPPGGGCLLTETLFAPKLKDFFSHRDFADESEKLAQSELLRIGRHFRVSETVKIVLGRDQGENLKLAQIFPKTRGMLFRGTNFEGPTALAVGMSDDNLKQIAGGMILFYSKPQAAERRIHFETQAEQGTFSVSQELSEERVKSWRI